MVDSTRSGDVVDECAAGAAGAAELVVEDGAGGEGEEALEGAFFDACEGSCAVAFEGEEVFAGREDRLDRLPDRREVGALSGLVLAAGPDDGGVELADGVGELAAGVALVAQERFASCSLAEREQFEADVALVPFGRGELKCPGVPSGAK